MKERDGEARAAEFNRCIRAVLQGVEKSLIEQLEYPVVSQLFPQFRCQKSSVCAISSVTLKQLSHKDIWTLPFASSRLSPLISKHCWGDSVSAFTFTVSCINFLTKNVKCEDIAEKSCKTSSHCGQKSSVKSPYQIPSTFPVLSLPPVPSCGFSSSSVPSPPPRSGAHLVRLEQFPRALTTAPVRCSPRAA